MIDPDIKVIIELIDKRMRKLADMRQQLIDQFEMRDTVKSLDEDLQLILLNMRAASEVTNG